MPRSNSTKVAPVVTTVPVITLEVDKKTYIIDGGANKHGRFMRLVEVINGRKNTLFMDHAKWLEIRAAIDRAADLVADLPLPENPPETPA